MLHAVNDQVNLQHFYKNTVLFFSIQYNICKAMFSVSRGKENLLEVHFHLRQTPVS